MNRSSPKGEQIIESPEEVLSTLGKDGKRRWLYPKVIRGTFFKYRRLLAYFLIALYVLLPFLRIGGQPVLLLNLVDRQFTIFGKLFLATDTVFLLLLILSILFTIFVATALLGRVWCGWACPQTVYLEFVFRPIEELIEGTPAERKKRDEGPANWAVIWRKALKYLVYALISAVLANAFIAYFVGSDELLQWIKLSPTEHPTPFLIMLFVTALMLFDFAYFREQMCTIACPYARLQAVLLDKNSVIVGYDEKRGEPRGRGRERSGHGDCVACNQCVAVCPTGIDIRNGLQLECLHCAACVDACDSVMVKIGKPPGLIRYSSSAEFKGEKTRLLRPRTILYLLLLTALLSALAFGLATRSDTRVQILRNIEQPYTVTDSGSVRNHVRINVANQGSSAQRYTLQVEVPSDVQIVAPVTTTQLEAQGKIDLNIFLTFPQTSAASEAKLIISSDSGFLRELAYKLQRPFK